MGSPAGREGTAAGVTAGATTMVEERGAGLLTTAVVVATDVPFLVEELLIEAPEAWRGEICLI